MGNIILADLKPKIYSIGISFFETVTKLPQDIRPDEKERTGIQILAWEEGRNLALVKVYEPSEAAQVFSVEKAVRSGMYGDYSSANSADPDRFQFEGSVTTCIDGVKITSSTSGLLSAEDVVCDILVQAGIRNIIPEYICQNILKNGGRLPDCIFQPKHYLHRFIYPDHESRMRR